jgi:hypothetical protein
MTAFSPVEIITLSFYAWELRGRGWDVAPYPVSLEPPFRPFRILPDLLSERPVVDDGKRPTLMSSLVESVRDTFRPSKALALVPRPAEPFEEPLPYPAHDEVPLLALHLELPEGHETKPKVMLSLLSALGTSLHPVALEIVGAEGTVRMQIVCTETDRDHVESQLLSFAPEVGVVEAENLVWAAGRLRALPGILPPALPARCLSHRPLRHPHPCPRPCRRRRIRHSANTLRGRPEPLGKGDPENGG